MVLNTKVLLHMPVHTRAGASVGKVSSLDMDSDTGKLVGIRVRVRGVVPGLLDDEIVVFWAQIIEITEKHVVIADAAVPVGTRWIPKNLAKGVSTNTT
jgi:sporulation protein YlmC with PRC-barrel domain